jgi:hypothetical protein
LPVWKSDFYLNGIEESFFVELHKITDELMNKPRDRKCVLILAEIIGFLSIIDSSFRKLSTKIANGMLKWSGAIDDRIDDGLVDHSHVSELRFLQCMYYIYGVVALGSGSDMQRNDAVLMCKFMVLSAESNYFSRYGV